MSKKADKFFKEVKDSVRATEHLQEAQEYMRNAAYELKQAYGLLRGIQEHMITAERLRSYIIGHLEVLIDRDHEWLSLDTNVQDIIDEIE